LAPEDTAYRQPDQARVWPVRASNNIVFCQAMVSITSCPRTNRLWHMPLSDNPDPEHVAMNPSLSNSIKSTFIWRTPAPQFLSENSKSSGRKPTVPRRPPKDIQDLAGESRKEITRPGSEKTRFSPRN